MGHVITPPSCYLVRSSQKLVALLLYPLNVSSVYIDQHVGDGLTVDTVNINDSRGFLLHVVHEGRLEERGLGPQDRLVTVERSSSSYNVHIRQLPSLQQLQEALVLTLLSSLLSLLHGVSRELEKGGRSGGAAGGNLAAWIE